MIHAILATHISFINEIAMLCENLGADVKEVVRGMGYDKRINARFLKRGCRLRRKLFSEGREGPQAYGRERERYVEHFGRRN